MQINILELLPNTSRSGFKLSKDISEDTVYVWYRKPQGGRIVEHTFPKMINITEQFIECLALCVGDGLNNPNIQNGHCNFANKNFELVRLIMNWWISLGYKKEKIFVSAHVKTGSSKDIILNQVREYFKIERAHVYFSDRNREITATIQIGNMVFQAFYLNLFQQLKEDILKDQELRRAFLRGLFAAEGHVKHSTFGTIESMSYAYNPHNEKDLALYVQECLKLENIDSKNSGDKIYFCDYNRMLKFYLIGGLDSYKSKKDKFERLCKNAIFCVHFKVCTANILRKYPQNALARAFRCCQSEVSCMIRRNRINLKYLKRALFVLDSDRNRLLDLIDYVKVKNSKISDKNKIAFLLSLHDFNNTSKIDVSDFYTAVNVNNFKFLSQLFELSKTGAITAKAYSHSIGESLNTAQQRLKKLSVDALLSKKRCGRDSTYSYSFTEKAETLFKELSQIYTLNGKIYSNTGGETSSSRKDSLCFSR